MSLSSRRVRLRRLLLLPHAVALLAVAPLLLLLPLGVLKWRLDHPPLTKTDKELRAAFGRATSVSINSIGSSWRQITGLPSDEMMIRNLSVRDKNLVDELVATLRCTDQEAPASFDRQGAADLTLCFSYPDPQPQPMEWNALTYVESPQGCFLQLCYFSSDNKELAETPYIRVQSWFTPQFEALLRDFAQRARFNAQAKQRHPDVSMMEMEF